MAYPIYNFNDPSLDYSAVEITVKQMYSSIRNNNGQCCASKKVDSTLSQADTFLQCMVIDAGDTVRYQSDVKSAYLLLYPLASDGGNYLSLQL